MQRSRSLAPVSDKELRREIQLKRKEKAKDVGLHRWFFLGGGEGGGKRGEYGTVVYQHSFFQFHVNAAFITEILYRVTSKVLLLALMG